MSSHTISDRQETSQPASESTWTWLKNAAVDNWQAINPFADSTAKGSDAAQKHLPKMSIDDGGYFSPVAKPHLSLDERRQADKLTNDLIRRDEAGFERDLHGMRNDQQSLARVINDVAYSAKFVGIDLAAGPHGTVTVSKQGSFSETFSTNPEVGPTMRTSNGAAYHGDAGKVFSTITVPVNNSDRRNS